MVLNADGNNLAERKNIDVGRGDCWGWGSLNRRIGMELEQYLKCRLCFCRCGLGSAILHF